MKAAPGRRLPTGGVPTGGVRMEGKNIYHDLMMQGMNIDGMDVPYQIIRNRDNSDVVQPGMTCFHTYLDSSAEMGNHKRNVRLYVGAPFARKIVDIAEMYETGKVPSR